MAATVPDGDRLSTLMAQASRLIEKRSGELSKSAIARELAARKALVLTAIDRLVDDGFVTTTRTKGDTGHIVYRSVRAYPPSDQHRNRSAMTAVRTARPRTKRRWPSNGTAADPCVYVRIGILARTS